MKEIKFRMWMGNKFHYWGFLEKDGHLYFAGITQSNKEPLTLEEVRNRSQQYTGLHDKNGKEIWESDVFDLVYAGEKEHKRFLVKYDDGCWVLYDKYNYPHWIISIWAKRGEVIGNIHEHGFLLEKTE